MVPLGNQSFSVSIHLLVYDKDRDKLLQGHSDLQEQRDLPLIYGRREVLVKGEAKPLESNENSIFNKPKDRTFMCPPVVYWTRNQDINVTAVFLPSRSGSGSL